MRKRSQNVGKPEQPATLRGAEQERSEIAQDLEAISAYEAKHGSFAEMARAHYEAADD